MSLLQAAPGPAIATREPACRWHVRLSQHSRTVMTAASKAAKSAAAAKPASRLCRQGHRLAEWGRKEIAIAETEMPGLMATREEYGPSSRCAARASRLAAHDDPDRGADRDAQGARRRRTLGFVQHLFDPGPRRRRRGRRRHAGVRGQGRDAQGLLGLSAPHLRMGRRRHAQHDPRRRRRRHAAGPSRAARRAGRHRPDRQADQRGRGSAVRGDQAAAQGQARLVQGERRRPSAA